MEVVMAKALSVREFFKTFSDDDTCLEYLFRARFGEALDCPHCGKHGKWSVTYKTAWRMGHEIRKFMAKVDGDDGLSGTVEADETYVGGKPRKHGKRGEFRWQIEKEGVFGMVWRGGG